MKEQEQIERYFSRPGGRKDVIAGVGDDCAVVAPPAGKQLAISCDTMVENVHFLSDMPAKAVAYKLVASNLSDLASMGAIPAWMTLSLSAPQVDEAWLEHFSASLFDIADYYGLQLIGGDTTSAPVKMLSLTIHGFIPEGKSMYRSGAQAGDFIYVTGTLGDSGLGLACLKNQFELTSMQRAYALQRHYYPTPRVLLGQTIRDVATSCTDLSDGLATDLPQLLTASNLGAHIALEQLPLSKVMQEAVSSEQAINFALSSGEDYELLFTVSSINKLMVESAAQDADVNITCIGQVHAHKDLRYFYHEKPWVVSCSGYEHFS
mgnify:CR=1 FL=1|tara:strand:- start:5977 stop:6936 length:960 start_codon:yes stop_codon:yes gene_type:complete